MAVSKFPWRGFQQAWEQGLACMYIPARYRSAPTYNCSNANTEFDKHRQMLLHADTDVKRVLYGHFPMQISLSHCATQAAQERFLPLMAKLPVVAASPLYKAKNNYGVTFTVTGQNIILRGFDVQYRNAEVASMFLVNAQAHNSPETSTLFAVDKHALGINLQMADASEEESLPRVSFHDVIINRDHMIGKVGEGEKLMELVADILQLD